MARLPILEFPDPRLRSRAEPVTVFDAALARLAADMTETMYAAKGIGLAATQVNVHRRLLIIDCSEHGDAPRTWVNPQLISSGGIEESEEGCLSVPGTYEKVKRAERVRARAQDVHGEWFELELEGLEAVCLQHEMDHLDGKLFVDYLSSLKRERIRKKLEKERRERDEPARPARAHVI
jgi:peptide deformylase